jgi:nucleoside 2-deoxyribosyltransferase
VPSLYVASPLGFSGATRGYYEDVLLPAVRRAGFVVLDPWSSATAQADLEAAFAAPPGAARLSALRAANARVGSSNASLIARCDGVLAVLDGVDVDSGTAAEIGFASGLGKPIVGLRLDTRLTGDNEAAVVNIQVEHFIAHGGGEISRTLDAAIELLAGLVS